MVLLDIYIDTATFFTVQVVKIDLWEWAVLINLFIILLLFAHRKKMVMIEKNPQYQFYVWGFYAKFFGALFFALVYYYYYNGGDTLRYFESSMSMANLFYKDPGSYLKVLFSPPTDEARSYFDFFTGFPYQYIFEDTKTYFVVKLVSPLTIITGKSYLLTSVLIGYLTYGGLWKLYCLFYSYYPKISRQLAFSILFIPSCIFWGSGVLKDSFTLVGTCYFVYYCHEIFILKKYHLQPFIYLLIGSFLILGIKPYIFILLFPGCLFWIFYSRLERIRQSAYAFMILPLIIVGIGGFSYFFFSSIGDSMDKFSVDKALETASVTQNDLKQEHYEGKSFDIGNFDGTVGGAIRFFPIATMAGMFKPFLWEADSPFMLLSALENSLLLFLFLRTFLRNKPRDSFGAIYNEPILMFCFTFAILFAFMLGITTSNYGALMRFKIPMLPFIFSGLYIAQHYIEKKRIENLRFKG